MKKIIGARANVVKSMSQELIYGIFPKGTRSKRPTIQSEDETMKRVKRNTIGYSSQPSIPIFTERLGDRKRNKMDEEIMRPKEHAKLDIELRSSSMASRRRPSKEPSQMNKVLPSENREASAHGLQTKGSEESRLKGILKNTANKGEGVIIVKDREIIEGLKRMSNYNKDNEDAAYVLEYDRQTMTGPQASRLGVSRIITPRLKSKRLSKKGSGRDDRSQEFGRKSCLT
jgi:uncharacterized protein YdaT